MKLLFSPPRAAALTISAACWLGASGQAGAQTPVGDYRFQNVYTSTGGTLGALTPLNPGGLSFVDATVNGVNQRVLQTASTNQSADPVNAANNEGGVQTPANPFASGSQYSALLVSSLTINTANVGATKVFDFKGLTTDAGLYVNATTGLLQFIDGTGVVVTGATGANPVTTGTYFQLGLTRTAAGVVTAYLDGTQQFQFTDTNNLAVIANVLTLFVDDGTGVGGTVVNEGTTGNIARLRLFNEPLSQAQVAAFAVPEPSTWAAVSVAGAVLGWLVLRRRTQAAA